MDPIDRHAVKCNLCNGQPECINHCREKALLYVDVNKAALHRRETVARGNREAVRGTNLRALQKR
jgi:Fe-S-cluster-containing hydrogenase component 2